MMPEHPASGLSGRRHPLGPDTDQRARGRRRTSSRLGWASPPQPDDHGDDKGGKGYTHGYPFGKSDSKRRRLHLVLREKRTDDGNKGHRGPDEAAPPGERAGLAEPPDGAEDVGVQEIVWPDALRQQRQRQGRQREESVGVPR